MANNINDTEKLERVPHDSALNYDEDYIKQRRNWISEKIKIQLNHIAHYSIAGSDARGNIENFIGVAQIPLGLMGPLLVNGDHAKGIFFVPMATTEGALVNTYLRGAVALTKAGGVRVFVTKDANHLDPVFILKSIDEARGFVKWINDNFKRIKEKAESTTHFGKLESITPYIIGRRVTLDVAYYTSDAMGANMIAIATEEVCKFISQETKAMKYFLRSNFSSEKKASAVNLLIGYGKEVSVEATVPRKIIVRYLNTTPEEIQQLWYSCALSGFSSGMFGINAHFGNGLAAIFAACGQDLAHVSNASVGVQSFEITENGDLYMFLRLPNIIIGTIGGGTALGTQKECLDILGCYGHDKAMKFAEIIGATLLAGELGICAGITSEHFLDPHKRARIHTREKAYSDKG